MTAAAELAVHASRSNGLVIDLHHVAKTYRGRIRALCGIDMQVRRGEVFGLLGPNGAGKSTLVKILMTVIRPSECRGTMLGEQVGHKPTLAKVGYLPEHHRFPPYLTGSQVVDFYGALVGVPHADRRRRTGELLELVGMKEWAGKKVGSYSKGMRQRIGIAQSLVNSPEVVLLDEPTDGVDPVGRRDIREIVQRLRSEGRTVFINSHLLSELEMVCDRVAILVQGRVVQQGTIDELTADKRRYEIELAAEPEAAAAYFQRALPEAIRHDENTTISPPPSDETAGRTPPTHSPLARRAGYHGQLASGEWLEIDRATLRIGAAEPATIQPIIDALRERGAIIRSIRQHRPSLEDLFMQAVTDPNTGATLKPGADRARKGRKP
ncbi:MAG: ABC transporter ATP-binding protein [Leptolyngbya sp. PLA2]|nr:ABC transporter ATP-binding protein [Leptolyngbya sp. PL-A2]MCQ3940129.1 ABC transporter ATP-binding protein [cyanobacterium CYA1]MCZ7632749.1 ABC transporter ATP-binding protein [Phycisphaerales bacterium]MDL1904134.1 ABC transporter ATP-binding protein [Synechococcales cyanobacterium CNB]GIK20113.1 MAG: ABC transporter ATP-binding protein [Planctomycetota bacterium]